MKNILMALICASTLVAALLACATQEEDMPQQTPVTAPTHVATQDVSAILERVENLAEQNDALRAELEDLKNEEDSDPRPTARPTATPTPPARFISATPSGPGICGRTPEIQQALIERLKIASCRLITEHELYRIRDLPDIRAPELRAGDFSGLVNLDSLSVQVRTWEGINPPMIPAGAFTGSRIKQLAISASNDSDTHATFEDGAFDGAHIQSLSIYLAGGGPLYDGYGELAGYRNPGRLPDSLPESLTWLRVSGDLRSLDWRIFQALPELEYLSLIHHQERSQGTSRAVVIALPTDAFADNPRLRGLELVSDSSWGTGTFRLSTGLLAQHEHLAHVAISKLVLRGPQTGGLPIQIHPDSPAATYVVEQGLRDWSDWQTGRDFRLSAASFPGR